jgi:hypothetical protein
MWTGIENEVITDDGQMCFAHDSAWTEQDEHDLKMGSTNQQDDGRWFAYDYQIRNEASALASFLCLGTDTNEQEVFTYLTSLLRKNPLRQASIAPATKHQILEDAEAYRIHEIDYLEWLEQNSDVRTEPQYKLG